MGLYSIGPLTTDRTGAFKEYFIDIFPINLLHSYSSLNILYRNIACHFLSVIQWLACRQSYKKKRESV